LGVLIDLLAEGAQQAVPVLDEGRLVGLVSRADLIAALAKAHHADDTAPDDPEPIEAQDSPEETKETSDV
jgi:CBS domain-containing membrane protein